MLYILVKSGVESIPCGVQPGQGKVACTSNGLHVRVFGVLQLLPGLQDSGGVVVRVWVSVFHSDSFTFVSVALCRKATASVRHLSFAFDAMDVCFNKILNITVALPSLGSVAFWAPPMVTRQM